jgi:hypothetical protein
MKLYNYFEEILLKDFLDANGLFLYNGLMSEEDLNDFCKKNDFRILRLREFQYYLDSKEDNFINLLKNIGLNQNLRYKIFIDNENFCYYTIKSNFIRSLKDPDIKEGIALLKPILKEKTFKNISDLKLNNIGLYYEISPGNIKRIICYDKYLLDTRQKPTSYFINPILFYGKIKDDGKDSAGVKIPYGAAMVAISAAREDVSGSEILYPMMAYCAENKMLIADRGSVSEGAYNVWEKMYKGRGKFKIKGPIDNHLDPVTPTKVDDGKIYNDGQHYKHELDSLNSEILNDPNKTDAEKEKHLLKLRKDDPLNWIYILNTNQNEIKEVFNKLESNHSNFNVNISMLNSLAYNLFEKRRYS